MSTLLTDAPFHYAEPIVESRCGNCTLCVQACPAHALKGTLWKAGMARGRLLDINRCIPYCDKIVKEHIAEDGSIHERICGKCFAVCAMTQRYLSISDSAKQNEEHKKI